MKKLSLGLMMILFFCGITMAQRTVTGTLTEETGDPLIGASIQVKGSGLGTVTDFDGNYTLEIPSGEQILVFSYTGYSAKEVVTSASTGDVINVVLSEGINLSEVVVTALGVAKEEKALGYAVQSVSANRLTETKAVNVVDALAGSAAGVQITPSSGAAGASSRIVIRGQTSFNGNNEALLVIDGVRVSNDENATERTLQGVANSNRGFDLNPNDIANISILKGAAATALYGIEGARGVVLITTKRGSEGGMQVDVTSNLTVSNYANITSLQNEYVQGSGGVWAGPGPGFFPNAVSWGPHKDDLYWDGSDYKWDKNGQITTDAAGNTKFQPYDNIDDFFGTGITSQNNFAISGGSKMADYRFSYGYTDDKGIVPNNRIKRHNLGLNVGSSLLDDKLKLRFSANYAKSGGTRVQQGSNISGVMLGLLRTPISFDNSNGLSDPVNNPASYSFVDNSQRNYRAGGGYDNPFWVVNNTPFEDEVNRFIGNLTASYKFSNWLNFQTTLGTDIYTDNRVQRYEIGSRTNPAGQIREDNYNYSHTDFYFNFLGGDNISEDLSLSYNVGVNMYSEELKQNYSQGDGLNFYGFPQLGNTQQISGFIDNFPEKTIGVFGTLDLGYKNFLYLSLTGRNDWSQSLINPFNEFRGSEISFFYPSASLGFVFSELLQDNSVLSFGKIRASYAEVGGGAPAAFQTATSYILPIQNNGTINDLNDGWTNGLGFPFQGVAGFVQNGVAGNANLKPSKTKDIEFGVDLRFLNGLATLDYTYYDRNSIDQIIAINIPNSTGFQRAVLNSGELATRGHEVVLGLNPIRKNGINWNVTFNFSTWKTTVEELPPNVPNQYLDGFTGTGAYNIAPIDDGNGGKIVYEYGQIRGGAFQRVNSPNGTFDANLPFNPDGALVIDDDPSSGTYGFPLPDPVARVVGNPNPDFLLGINNRFQYKDLNLSFLFDIKQGGDVWNGTKGAITFFGRSELSANRGTTQVFEGVKASDYTANNIEATLDENWYTGNGGGFGSVDEHFVEDGSFMRLRYLTLGYDLTKLLSGTGIKGLQVNLTGRNLLLITDYDGDPETSLVGSSSNGQGLDYFNMPNTKSYTFGINLTF